jgi:alpha-L-rhamnosidase
LLEPGFQFGDWLDPDAPPSRPWEAKADSQFIANAFFAESARLAAEAAEVIATPNDEIAALRGLAREMAGLTWARWRDHIYETQTGCAIGLRLGIVPDEERVSVANSMAAMVRAAGGRISTGFLGTPHVLHALAEGGHLAEAFSMLLRETHPSWLYQVVNDATTVWERWDAIRVDGSIHPGIMDPPDGAQDGEGGHMLSFNHYAYGAVVDWIYRYLAGISPDRHHPGYRRVILAPKPVAAIDWVDASVDSGYGTIRSRWELRQSGNLAVDLTIPAGVTGHFVPPVRRGSEVTIDGAAVDGSVDLPPGSHLVVVTNPAVSLSEHPHVD